jgi:hypothetical protein
MGVLFLQDVLVLSDLDLFIEHIIQGHYSQFFLLILKLYAVDVFLGFSADFESRDRGFVLVADGIQDLFKW